MIDITTGASKYTDPWKSVVYALEQGVSIDKLSFSSDGHAGLAKKDENGNLKLTKAPIFQNLEQVQALVKLGNFDVSEAVKLVTSNPAKNLGLKHKGVIKDNADSDLCFFNNDFELTDVWARGKQMILDGQVLVKGSFEK